MKKVNDKVFADEKEEVSYHHLHKFDKQYDEIIKTVYEESPILESAIKKHGR